MSAGTGFIPINLLGVQAAEDFPLYPDGPYLLQVDSFEYRTNQDGQTQRISLKNQIVMGPGLDTTHQNKTVFSSYQLTEKGAPFFMRFLAAIGITQEMIASWGGQVPEGQIVNKRYVAQMATNEYNGKKYNNLSREKSAEEWNAIAQSTGQQTQGMSVPNAAPAPQPGLLQPAQPAQPQMAQPQQPMMQQPPQQPAMALPSAPPPPGTVPQG